MSSLLYVFLLFAAFISHNGAAVEPVKDIYGKPLLVGISYFVLPVVRGGGVLTVIESENTTCPTTVVQDQSKFAQGMPLEFLPSVKSRTIPVSTDLNFQFTTYTIWELDNFDETTNQWFVSTCGEIGNPGRETVDNWFKIDKFEGNYKIRFCPSVCNFCKVMCRDIGVFVKDGKRRLALSDVPLIVKFKKA
ncbi:unnamed protein product [Microthlaspi erraticum]|uniref:Uncharacterized protein n=1 Tax=Microthlaspi erraticum TaxID=1685480 RepID=A0A6D2IQX2_9BRAS|nr:unnamed protein product [Microthlaspi erraticum]